MFNNDKKTPKIPSFKARNNHNRSKSFCPGEILPFNAINTVNLKTPKQTSPPPSLQNTVQVATASTFNGHRPPATSPKRPSAHYHSNTKFMPFTPFQKRLNQDAVHSPTIPDDDDDYYSNDDEDVAIAESELSSSESHYSSFINNNNNSFNTLRGVSDKENCVIQPVSLRCANKTTTQPSAMSITPPPMQLASSSSSLSLLKISDDMMMENPETDVEMNEPDNKNVKRKKCPIPTFKKPFPINISNDGNNNNTGDTDDDLDGDDDDDDDDDDDVAVIIEDHDNEDIGSNNNSSSNGSSQLVRSETVPLFSSDNNSISNLQTALTTSLTPEPQHITTLTKGLSSSLAPLVLESPDNFHKLPHRIIDKGCFTNPSVVADVISNFDNYRDKYDKWVIIDCRYWYEYDGGHINGAIQIISRDNFNTESLHASNSSDYKYTFKDQIKKLFFNESLLRNREECKRTLIFFHCEFSQKRGPEVYDIFRHVDREIHQSEWPFLLYPEMYIIRGGYTAFFTHFSNLCTTNVHIKMNDPNYEEEMARCNTHFAKIASKKEDDLKKSFSTSSLPNNTSGSRNGRNARRPNVRMNRLFDDEGESEKVNEHENTDFGNELKTPFCSKKKMSLVTPVFRRCESLSFNKIDFDSIDDNNKEDNEKGRGNNDDDDEDGGGDFFLRSRSLFN